MTLKLPPSPKIHRDSASQHVQRLLKAALPLSASGWEKTSLCYVGRPYPGGYVMQQTKGDIAVLVKGEGKGQLLPRLSPVETIRLTLAEPAFELVLRRARTCANKRTHALCFHAEQEGLNVEAQDLDVSRSELFPCSVPGELLGQSWIMRAEYLLAAGGRGAGRFLAHPPKTSLLTPFTGKKTTRVC